MTTHRIPVQGYLETHSPRELFAEHGITIAPSTCGRVVSASYDQLAARKTDPMAIEARGHVLRILDGAYSPTKPLGKTVILARFFRRFFNHGEGGPEHQVDLTHPLARFEEKLDGSLVGVYFDPYDRDGMGRWHVATRTVPQGDKHLGGGYTARELYEKSVGYGLETFTGLCGMNPGHTYLSELCTPFNEVHVLQDEFKATLLGIRDTQTGVEYDPEPFALQAGIPSVKVHKFGSVEETLRYIHSQHPRKHEGMVAKILHPDGSVQRTKIKNAAYVATAHLTGMKVNSPRSVMSLVLTGCLGDVADSINAHMAEMGRKFELGLAAYAHTQDALYDKLCPTGTDRKTLAIAAGKNGLAHAYAFARFQGDVTNYVQWVNTQRKDGGWSDSFLDGLVKSVSSVG